MDYFSVKRFLRKLNNFFEIRSKLHIEKELEPSLIYHPTFIEKQKYIRNSFAKNFLILHYETNKIKYFLERLNANLLSISKLRTLYGKHVRFIIYGILITFSITLVNSTYILVSKY